MTFSTCSAYPDLWEEDPMLTDINSKRMMWMWKAIHGMSLSLVHITQHVLYLSISSCISTYLSGLSHKKLLKYWASFLNISFFFPLSSQGSLLAILWNQWSNYFPWNLSPNHCHNVIAKQRPAVSRLSRSLILFHGHLIGLNDEETAHRKIESKKKNRKNTQTKKHIYNSSKEGIRMYDPSARTVEESKSLGPRGYCD